MLKGFKTIRWGVGGGNHTFVSLVPRHLNRRFWASFGHDLATLQDLPSGAVGLWQTA